MFSRQQSKKAGSSGSGGENGKNSRGEGGANVLASTAAAPAKTPSIIANDMTIKGNVTTTGDLRIDGTVQGDIRANVLTVSENGIIRGEVVVDDAVIGGNIDGRIRGIKVRLTSTAMVAGDIIHSLFAVESGAQFQGAVIREENPLGDAATKKPAPKNDSSKPAMSSGGGVAAHTPPKNPVG